MSWSTRCRPRCPYHRRIGLGQCCGQKVNGTPQDHRIPRRGWAQFVIVAPEDRLILAEGAIEDVSAANDRDAGTQEFRGLRQGLQYLERQVDPIRMSVSDFPPGRRHLVQQIIQNDMMHALFERVFGGIALAPATLRSPEIPPTQSARWGQYSITHSLSAADNIKAPYRFLRCEAWDRHALSLLLAWLR